MNNDPSPTTELAVSASGLVKTFADLRAVDGVDLEVRRGEVFGVLGPNGAGKTTMLQMLATLLPMDGGHAEIFGVDVKKHPHVVRQLVGVTGQYASVDENLTARENLFLFGQLLGLDKKSARATAEDLLGRFGLEEAGDKQISQFSGGMRRRLDLAASLIHRPPLIFLDEPTTGLDPRTRGQMWDTIRELVGRRLHGAADHAVPRRGRPARRPDRGHRPRRQGRRGHLRPAQEPGRLLDAAAAAARPGADRARPWTSYAAWSATSRSSPPRRAASTSRSPTPTGRPTCSSACASRSC